MLDIVGDRALTATPAFSIHGLCNPITCNVGLHTGATLTYTLSAPLYGMN